jgi:hypothetical protein
MQQERTNSQDNYLRNKADDASAKMVTKMMNVHMAKMQGADILDVAEEDVERLRKAGYFDDNPDTPEPSEGELEIMYEELKDTFTFEYDPRPEADEEEKNRWLELIDIATSNPNVLPAVEQSGYRFNIGEAFKKVISASGADEWEKVLVQIDPEELLNSDQEQLGPDGLPIQPEGIQTQPGVENAPQVPQNQPEDELTVTMQEYGVPEDVATAIIAARRQGFNEEEILNYLQGANNG